MISIRNKATYGYHEKFTNDGFRPIFVSVIDWQTKCHYAIGNRVLWFLPFRSHILHDKYEECAKGTRRQKPRTHYDRNEFLESHIFLRNFHKKYKKFHCSCKTLLNACRNLAPDLESFNLQQIPIVKMLIEKQMFTYKFYNDTKRFLDISPYQQYTVN